MAGPRTVANAPRGINSLPAADEKPDTARAPFQSLTAGSAHGWLTVITAPTASSTRMTCRCVCGALTNPTGGQVASGKVRSCGSLSEHGIH